MASSAIGTVQPTGAAVPIRIFRATELPPEVPAALFSDGEASVILVNDNYAGDQGEILNSLLAAAEDTGPRHLRAVV